MIFTIGVLSFVIITIVIGIVVSRKVTDVEDYYVSGRNASTILIAGSLIASFFSTVAFMGEAGDAYLGYPLIMLLLSSIDVSGYVIGAIFFGRYIRRSRALTLPQYFGERFNSKRVRRLSAITTIIGMGAYLVSVTQGISLLVSNLLEIDFIYALLIVWTTYTLLTFLSGAKGVLLTDTIMYFVFTVATFISIPFILKKVGGWPEAISKTAHDLVNQPNILDWHGITGEGAFHGMPHEALIWAIILGLAWTCVLAISPWQTSRYLMAKNEHVILRSAVVATISVISIYIILFITMATVNLINPSIDPPEMVFIWSAKNFVPTFIGVVVISGIMAAGLSSASTFLQLIGNSLANDIFNLDKQIRKGRPTTTLRMSKLLMLMSGVVVLIITIFPPPAVLWIGFFAATIFAASWAVVGFTSIHSKRVNEKSAFWGMLLGLVGIVGGELFSFFIYPLPVYLEPVLIGVILSVVGVIYGVRTGEATSEEKDYLKKLLTAPRNLFDRKEIKVTNRFANALIIFGFIIIGFTFFYYYYPVNIY
ncbi:Sodium/pantothenate symporter [Lentibacillus sp. JNUCC-1]|uniref:sodium:solute symporter family protein n=1 Tax=Lentibacillus sp. JNUCC-1 TaxID=2654513 RepID=UPI0012E85FA6|nr:sodium:solute symporter family protein [Lentibacillus sp. JNUCC-1]MUV37634.1 Sodium/pantothenate symporter [Lentibacillus sp. JNUCC-1]